MALLLLVPLFVLVRPDHVGKERHHIRSEFLQGILVCR